MEAVVEMKLTAAGTVPDSHRIPSSAHDESDSSDSEQPFSIAKISRKFDKINRFCFDLSVKNAIHSGVFGIIVCVDLFVIVAVEFLFAEIDIGREVKLGALRIV